MFRWFLHRSEDCLVNTECASPEMVLASFRTAFHLLACMLEDIESSVRNCVFLEQSLYLVGGLDFYR
jgi:hypothetical protein